MIKESVDGNADMSKIDELVETWHESSYDGPLHEFLGVTREQYAAWVEQRISDEELLELGGWPL